MKKKHLSFFSKLNKLFETNDIEISLENFLESNSELKNLKRKINQELQIMFYGVGINILRENEFLTAKEMLFAVNFVKQNYLANIKFENKNYFRERFYSMEIWSDIKYNIDDRFKSVNLAMGIILDKSNLKTVKKDDHIFLDSGELIELNDFLKNQILKFYQRLKDKFDNNNFLNNNKLVISSLLIFIGLCLIAFSIAYSNRYEKVNNFLIYDKWKNKTINTYTGKFINE